MRMKPWGFVAHWGWAWASPTLVRLHCSRMCVYACLWPLTENFSWARLNVSQRLNMHSHSSSVESDSEETIARVHRAWSEDHSSWSTHCNLRMIYCKLSQLRTMTDQSQTVCMMAKVASGKGHAKTTLQKFSSRFGCSLCMCSYIY